jgi:GH35 family endo-1,4-beta-xylanase
MMYMKHCFKTRLSLLIAVVMVLGILMSVPVFASGGPNKFTFTPSEKAVYESNFVPASASEAAWISGFGYDDVYSLQGRHITGESYANEANAIRFDLPEALPAGYTYFIQVSFFVPSELNQSKSGIRGPGVVLNGAYSNTAYNLPANNWLAGTIEKDKWQTLGVNTPVMGEDLTSIDFRFWGSNETNHPDVWYIDNIEIKRAEWDLSLPSLAEAYKDSFLVGNITSPDQQDAQTTEMFKRQYNVVTAENSMKPQYLSSAKGQYDFSGAEPVVTWAEENGILLHGHTLVWHSQSARWLTTRSDNTPVTRAEARENMQEYISTVAGYYAGKVISWDVVNEAFDGGSLPFDNWRDVLRKNSPWYRAYENGADTANGESGADYIYDAFVFARLTDPNAILEYNDYNETDDWKREAMAQMAEELNEKWKTDPRNTEPDRKLIEGLGMQSHHFTQHPDVSEVEATIRRFIKAGVRITVSELDVPVGYYNGPTSPVLTYDQQVEQAIYYARLFEYYKAYDAHITRVTFWGKSDSQSWRGTYSPQLFDRSLAPKEAFYAVLDPSGYLMGKGLEPRPLYDLAVSSDIAEIASGEPAEITVTAAASDLDDYSAVAYIDKDGVLCF